MKQQLTATIMCLLVMVMGVSLATAASFDLLLKGDWAYADLALLADAHLLEGYDSEQELAAVFPLTRYEVALLVEEVLGPGDQLKGQNEMSSDTLMWEILERRTTSDEVDLSPEIVAQARLDSEGAYKALARLTQEFVSELDALGLTRKTGNPRVATTAGSGALRVRTLAWLGATQLVGVAPSMSADANGYTLSSSLGVQVVPIHVKLWQSDHAVRNQGPKETEPKGIATISPPPENQDVYAPVEVMALFEEQQQDQVQQTIWETQTEVSEGGSLRLQPDMTDKRPMGLLTSYFLGSTSH